MERRIYGQWKPMTRNAHDRLDSALTPQAVLLGWLPAAYAAFATGLLISSLVYSRSKGFHLGFESFVISDLESHKDNPHGFAAGATGTALCGLLLFPSALFLYRRLRLFHTRLALAGLMLFAAGLAAAVSIGCLAPIAQDYSLSHIQLAFAAFIGISAGKLIWMLLASRAAIAVGHSSWRVSAGIGLFDSAILLFLVFLYFAPDGFFFNDDHLWTSLAFCEWGLCADCAATLWILAAVVSSLPNVVRPTNRKKEQIENSGVRTNGHPTDALNPYRVSWVRFDDDPARVHSG